MRGCVKPRCRWPLNSKVNLPGGAALTGATRCELGRGPCRPGKALAAARRNNGTTEYFPVRAASGRATASVLIPDRLRSQYFFCVMSFMAQGAHRGRPVAAAPCTPGLRPATSPLRGTFDFSLQASGRAEAASVQNTALSPHPCGLPRPSGNVSAILRPPAPAVSAAPCPAVIHILGLDPVGRVRRQPPPGEITGTAPDILPGGAALA
ncbi:hypothetical protein SB5610_00019 [Klebsiella variicola]|nr:hypothetical protein SB5610_00019 [Klebsiella variicola]